MLPTGIAVPLRDGSLSRTSLFAPRPLSRSSSIAFRGALASRIFFLRATSRIESQPITSAAKSSGSTTMYALVPHGFQRTIAPARFSNIAEPPASP